MHSDSNSLGNLPEKMRVHIAAKHLKCCDRTVTRWINKGRLRAERLGKRLWLVWRCDVQALCNERGLSCCD
jgi:excisionase family DNA binding protein